MTPHKQLFRHDPENGVYGDCGRTAIACLLDLHPSQVPHFYDGPCDPEQSMDAMKAWLAGRNITLLTFALSGELSLAEAMCCMENNQPDVWYIVVGRHTEQADVDHVLICRGDRIVHDPHPDNCGITVPSVTGVWFIEILVQPVGGEMRPVPADCANGP